MRILLLLGLLLVPFSTSVDSGYPVISFGLPLLLLALAFAVTYPVGNAFSLPKSVAPALMAGGAIVVVMGAFTFNAPYVDRSLARLAPNLICFFLVFRLVRIYFNDRDFAIENGLRALAMSGAVMALYYILNMTVAVIQNGVDAVLLERYTGGLAALPWGASNNVSAALVFPHAACHALRWRCRDRWSGPLLFLILLAVAMTFSRAGMLVHGMLFLSACILCRNYRYLFASMLVLVALLWLSAHHLQEYLDLLMSTRFSPDREISNGRLDSFSAKSAYFLDHMMAPIGYYGSLFIFNGLTAHNLFLTVLVEQGFPGLIAMLLFLAACWYALFRTRKLPPADMVFRRILAAGAIFSFTNLMVEDAYFTQPYIIYFWTYFFIVMMFSAGLHSTAREMRMRMQGELAHG